MPVDRITLQMLGFLPVVVDADMHWTKLQQDND